MRQRAKSSEKIIRAAELKDILRRSRRAGRKIVFTNGCYDILHAGHVQLLGQAKGRGDILVAALNTDRSVRRIKGPGRPLNRESDRAAVIAALEAVDYVTFFSEDTPERLIRTLKPDIIVKGGDWAAENIAGAGFIESYGGRVLSLPFKKGYSTTSLIERIRGRCGAKSRRQDHRR